MRNKNFLNEATSIAKSQKSRPASLTLTIAPADELFGIEDAEIIIKSEDRRLLQELMLESEVCKITGEHPKKIAKLLKEAHYYGSPPKKTEDGGLVYSNFTPNTLNLSDCPRATITALESFRESLISLVPDISEQMSDGFTDEQKYLLRMQRNFVDWVALGLFHRIFGLIPDLLSTDDCPLNDCTFKPQVLDTINVRTAEFQLITAGEKYIKSFAKRHSRAYLFNRPLDLFLNILKDSIDKGVASIIYGDKEYQNQKKVNKTRTMFKKFVTGGLEGKDREEVETHLYSEGWTGLVALALTPLYASRDEQHFKKLWDVYLTAKDIQSQHEAKLKPHLIDRKGDLYIVKSRGKRQKLKIYWEDEKLLVGSDS